MSCACLSAYLCNRPASQIKKGLSPFKQIIFTLRFPTRVMHCTKKFYTDTNSVWQRNHVPCLRCPFPKAKRTHSGASTYALVKSTVFSCIKYQTAVLTWYAVRQDFNHLRVVDPKVSRPFTKVPLFTFWSHLGFQSDEHWSPFCTFFHSHGVVVIH